MLSLDLSNRIAVVTGATGQLGRVMVRTLADCGADIAICYNRNAEMANRLADEVSAIGRRALAVQADVTDKASTLALRDQVLAGLGTAEIVVDNAVIQYSWKSVLEQDPADYESQFRSCVLHNVLMAQAFVPGMIERGRGGRVIGINTECAGQNFPSQSAYVSGKRGMDGVLRVLAREIGAHQITVNQVAPGWTISERDRENHSEVNEGYSTPVPLKRRGTDQEIANVVAFLASDLSSFITGAYIPVCGGTVMPGI
jgi:3-oxoacyl-[acyl-carrier protein] reductase